MPLFFNRLQRLTFCRRAILKAFLKDPSGGSFLSEGGEKQTSVAEVIDEHLISQTDICIVDTGRRVAADRHHDVARYAEVGPLTRPAARS